jgi:DNA-binding winged helix-turn-helix (wHTH) protein/tetratricopeptide (TPR) repeat protein
LANDYVFGDFRLQARERRLSRGDEVVPLEPKAFDLLTFLATHPGRLVEKQELVDAVWSRAEVTDNSLTRCVHQVRSALDDDAESPRFIETVTGAGYRFIASVQTGDPSERETQVRRLPRPAAILLITGALLAASLMLYETRQPPNVERIAVLPLANLTGNPDQAYIVDGIHEMLINHLSGLNGVDVISRTTSLAYRDTDLTLPEIVSLLKVDAILEGSVAQADSGIAVAVQLMQADPERQLWSEHVQRDAGDTQGIALALARGIATTLGTEESQVAAAFLEPATPVEPEAFDAFLQGRFYLEQRTADGFRSAERHFLRAIELDARFAASYVGLAEVMGSAAAFGLRSPAESYPESQRLARQAIALDSNLAYAHMALAAVDFYWNWDWPASEQRLRRALELNPNLAASYRLLAEVLSMTGRHEAALAAIERGRELDPMAPVSRFKPVLIVYLKGDYERAIERALSLLDTQPGFWQGHWLLCLSRSALKRHAEAVNDCQHAATTSRRAPMALGALGYVHALNGESEAAGAVLAELEALGRRRYVGPAALAIVHGALGNHDRAFELLEEGYRARDQLMIHLDHSSFFDPLRADPRFAALRNRTIREP